MNTPKPTCSKAVGAMPDMPTLTNGGALLVVLWLVGCWVAWALVKGGQR